MTPFGDKMRQLRAAAHMTQAQMAAHLGVSAAYLSALENGRKGLPSWALVQKIITLFNLIWDEAEEIQDLARISHPRVVVDTGNLSPAATEMANILSRKIDRLDDDQISDILTILKK